MARARGPRPGAAKPPQNLSRRNSTYIWFLHHIPHISYATKERMRWQGAHGAAAPWLDGLDGNVGTHEVDGILGLDNEISGPAFDFDNGAGIFLVALD